MSDTIILELYMYSQHQFQNEQINTNLHRFIVKTK